MGTGSVEDVLIQGRLILDALTTSLYSSPEERGEWQPAVQANIQTLEDQLCRMKEALSQIEVASKGGRSGGFGESLEEHLGLIRPILKLFSGQSPGFASQ